MKLQERRATRYPTLANIIILCVGLLLVLAGFLLRSDGFDLGSLLVGIGSDTIVVAVVFFLGRLLLVDPQDELKESLARLEAKIGENHASFLLSRLELGSRLSIEDIITRSRDLLLGGTNLRGTVQGYKSHWLEKIERGGRLRFLVLDPESPDTEAIAQASAVQRTGEDVKTELRLALQTLKAFKRKAESIASTSVEIRVQSRQPPFGFALINPDSPDGILSVGLRLYGTHGSGWPYWILRPGDEWFDAFADACEKLWDASKPIA